MNTELKKKGREFRSKLPRVGLLLLLFYLLSLSYKQQNQVTPESVPLQNSRQVNIPAEAVKKYFSDYSGLNKESEVLYRVRKEQEELGKLIVTTPIADDIIGFSGNVPLFLAVSLDNKVLGLELLENSESPDFMQEIMEKGFFDSWNGKTLEEAVTLKVDGVSGASMTTGAVTESIRRALGYQLNTDAQVENLNGLDLLRNILGGGVILLAIASMFVGGKLKKYRWILQVASILVVGVWCGYFVSFAMLYGWLLNGVPLTGRFLLVMVTLLAFFFPLFMGKAWYCFYLCPFGAAQELTGKLKKKKWVLKGPIKKIFKYTRVVYFVLVLILLFLGTTLDLTLFEPFTVFMFAVATRWVMGVTLFFLILSVFLVRPWCNYFCLTGELLEILRRGKADQTTRTIVREWFILLFLVIFVLFILW